MTFARLSTSPPGYNFNYLTLQQRPRSNSDAARHLQQFRNPMIKVLLLENINQKAVEAFTNEGYDLEVLTTSLPEDQLIERIQDVHMIGIRSKTKLNKKVLSAAKELLIIGCFCIGTNQVDLDFAAEKGIAVFNSPFSNSRSVAELIIGEIVALTRQFCDRSGEMHQGIWKKVSSQCWEIRGKTLGIVGYGHIGCQLSVLAESMGIQVIYYDIVPLMPLGTAQQVNSLDELLERADFVSLHVPESPETNNMITKKQLKKMKLGSYLLNASRGSVVDIPALIEARKSGHIAGFALDVYPSEPASNGLNFNSHLNAWTDELLSLSNVILTPHIGGSTEEAQCAIGKEVSDASIKFLSEGSSIGAVNFPEVSLRPLDSNEHAVRVLLVHKNIPGVLSQVTSLFQDVNIKAQFSDSRKNIAYVIFDAIDVSKESLGDLYATLEKASFTIKLRLLF